VPLRAIAHSGGFLAEGLPMFEIRDVGGMTDMLVSNAKLGRALAEKLGDKAAILMRGHGFAATGKSLPYVVGRSIYIGVAAKLQADAIALGGTITYLDPEEGRKIEARRDYTFARGSCGSARRWGNSLPERGCPKRARPNGRVRRLARIRARPEADTCPTMAGPPQPLKRRAPM
jgi:Class II Aldolase and Adducin N-terminal domain